MNQSAPGHRARKRFGQNFLVDQGVIQRIISAIGPRPEDRLVEIGPGQGALTEWLLQACPHLQVIELDRDLIPLLRARFAAYPGLQLHQGDALKFDFAALADGEQSPQPLRIVGNLPYNISTPLIFHLLSFQQRVQDMHFMLQKEVVQRLCAQPGTKAYGRLGIMVQYHCRVEQLFAVPPHAFRPAPKVESAIVRLIPHGEPPLVARDVGALERLVNAAFQQRRKTLRNALRSLLPAAAIEALEIDPGIRAENLTLVDFVRLSDQLAENSPPEGPPTTKQRDP